MRSLNAQYFQSAMAQVNELGFASIDLSVDLPEELGQQLYEKMNIIDLHPSRARYYNEIAFYWPEDWSDVKEGIGSFHEQKSLKYIYPKANAQEIMTKNFGESTTNSILNFTEMIKNLTISNHIGLKNNELRLARVMLRQMNESDKTTHGGSDYHEDSGYQDRPYQQLLSVILTTDGIPTTAKRYTPKVGELLIFNALDRRHLLGLNDELAFIHTGPKTGPKMFFFFEFLGPRQP
jgi:hypothetical protein